VFERVYAYISMCNSWSSFSKRSS